MYHFQNIQVGPTTVDIEADTLREAWDQMGHLYSLHKDALFLAAHVEFFHDVEPEVVPKSRDDDAGYVYRGFECLRTGCNITFKEKQEEGGVYPGRFKAYMNGNDKPKLYDPVYDRGEILEKVGPDTPFVKQFNVNIGENGHTQRRQQGARPTHGPPPGQGGPPAKKGQSGADQQSNGERAFKDLPPKQKVKRVEGNLNSLSLSERPQFLARLASWRNSLPDDARSELDDVITQYATDDAYDARMEEMDQELYEASEEGEEALRESCFEAAKEVSGWPPDYREPARAVIAGHAPDDVDVEPIVYQNADPAPAQ